MELEFYLEVIIPNEDNIISLMASLRGQNLTENIHKVSFTFFFHCYLIKWICTHFNIQDSQHSIEIVLAFDYPAIIRFKLDISFCALDTP